MSTDLLRFRSACKGRGDEDKCVAALLAERTAAAEQRCLMQLRQGGPAFDAFQEGDRRCRSAEECCDHQVFAPCRKLLAAGLAKCGPIR